MTPVQKLKQVFSNFEGTISRIPTKKVELSGSKTTIDIDRWRPQNSNVRQGVNYDFVRFYKGQSPETKEMTLGFSFMFEPEDAPVVVAIHDGLKRYVREVPFEEFREALKLLTRLISEDQEKHITGFLHLTTRAFDVFNLNKGIRKEYRQFDIDSAVEKATEATSEEVETISKTKEVLAALHAKSSEIKKRRDEEIKQAIIKIEEKYFEELNPVEEEILNTLDVLESNSKEYVSKLKTTFNNYDMTMEKFLMYLAKEITYPDNIVPYIMEEKDESGSN